MTDRDPHPDGEFIANVERLRRRRRLSVRELAVRSDLSLEEVQAVLRGESKVPLDVVILLARGLEVRPGELIDGIAEVGDDA